MVSIPRQKKVYLIYLTDTENRVSYHQATGLPTKYETSGDDCTEFFHLISYVLAPGSFVSFNLFTKSVNTPLNTKGLNL